MIGTEFLDYLTKFQVATYVGVEDFADKFNFLITVMILLLCTTIVTVKQYMMKPISCYMATDLGGKNLLDYVENYCWVQGTVPLAYSGRIPETEEGWKKLEEHKLLYYQWVPFVLGLQCILFYLPRVIWQMICYNRAGTDIQHLVLCANQAVHADEKKRNELVNHLAHTLEQLLFQKPQQEKGKLHKVRKRFARIHNLLYISRHLGSRLYAIYLFIKLLYLANAVGQIYMMQSFLGLNGRNYTLFGLSIAHEILSGQDWEVSMVFPRVGFCVIPVRNMGAINHATAQCVLPVNMLNERIYIFLWFWIVLASTITAISIPIWFMRMTYQKSRYTFIKRYLRMTEQIAKKDKPMVHKFTRQFLKHDGIFLLRMISSNAGELICADIIRQLWHIFIQKKYYQLLPDDGQNDQACRTAILMQSDRGDVSTDPIKEFNPVEPTAPVEEIDDIAQCKKKMALAV